MDPLQSSVHPSTSSKYNLDSISYRCRRKELKLFQAKLKITTKVILFEALTSSNAEPKAETEIAGP